MADCPHGEVHPSACPDCVEGVPAPVQKWSALTTMIAEWSGFCARDDRHAIQPGEYIYAVAGEGWCCGRCAELSALGRPVEQTGTLWAGQGYVQADVRVVTSGGITQLWCKICGATVEKPAEQIDARAEIRGHRDRGCPF